jgi:hypothetical protein
MKTELGMRRILVFQYLPKGADGPDLEGDEEEEYDHHHGEAELAAEVKVFGYHADDEQRVQGHDERVVRLAVFHRALAAGPGFVTFGYHQFQQALEYHEADKEDKIHA